MSTGPVYVVLGGKGRLGRHLLAKLRAQGRRAIGLSRQPDTTGRQHADWIRADLTATSDWRQAQKRLSHLLVGEEEVVLADLLLDRTSVTSMRRSICAATAFTLRTQDALAANGFTVRVLAASTTAALAPCLLQTPYGRAKRQQAIRYARLAHIDLVLLPQLLHATDLRSPASPTRTTVGNTCTYAFAATSLATISQLPATRSLWVVRGNDPHPDVPHGLGGLPTFLAALALSCTVSRNNPAAHRRASREGLALLPPRIRAQVDHHGAPERLVRGFARHIGVSQMRTIAAGPQPAPLEEHDEERP
ncbi:NAD-dependent epimerase/dehydratase family protein [Streptomyces sparsus]